LENLDTEVNIDRAWETTGWCIKWSRIWSVNKSLFQLKYWN
jgi:hypothetical protein